VLSTAAATLRQFVVFIVDKVVEEDRRMLLELESITLPDVTTQALCPPARDAFTGFYGQFGQGAIEGFGMKAGVF
jgi:hypothetical protein